MPLSPGSLLASVAGGALLVVGLAACAPQTAEDRARGIVERWVAAAKAGSDDAAYAVTCPGAPLGGVSNETAGFESYTIDLEYVSDGDFDAIVTRSYADYADLVETLRVQTDGDPCIKWVR